MFSTNSQAQFDNFTEVAQIFGEIIYYVDLEPDPRRLKINRSSYPELSDQEILNKLRERKLSSMIWQRINQKLVQEHNLEPTDKELASYTDFLNRREKKRQVSPEIKALAEDPELQKMMKVIHKDFLRHYKIGRFLYQKYGGTVIFQQANPQEPVGAYRKLLEDYTEQGLLSIYPKEFKDAFWQYYLANHSGVISPEKVDFSKFWWEKHADKLEN